MRMLIYLFSVKSLVAGARRFAIVPMQYFASSLETGKLSGFLQTSKNTSLNLLL